MSTKDAFELKCAIIRSVADIMATLGDYEIRPYNYMAGEYYGNGIKLKKDGNYVATIWLDDSTLKMFCSDNPQDYDFELCDPDVVDKVVAKIKECQSK